MKKLLLINAIAFTMVACGGGNSSSKSEIPSTSSTAATSSSEVASSSVTTSTVSSAASSNAASKWELVWSDDFDGSAIDTNKWSFEKNCTGGGNNELQCYTDRAENSYVSDSKLHIIAKKESFSGQSKNDDDPTYNAGDTSAKRDYTSARLRSKNKGDWKYGRMEIRAKLPQGQGVWPAIWMLPTEWKYGSWPLSGEIDIMEAINSNTATQANKVYGTLHYGDVWPNNKNTGDNYSPPKNVWDEYHTYAIEWEEGEIRWYVDNKHYMTENKKGWYTKGSTNENAPFDQKFHMLLNVAVGGAWPGNPDSKTMFPQEMTVDFVKVYRCTVDATTGKGCSSNVDPAVKPLTGHPQVGGVFAEPPLFNMYGDALDTGLKFDSYNPNGAISYSQITEANHGTVLNVVKTGETGNVYFTILSGVSNLSAWSSGGELVFNLKVNTMADGAKLLIKMDSGWPSVSDVVATLPATGVWGEYRINISDLIARGNSIESGIANLSAISNIFVIEPTAAMNVSLDNIRLVKL